MRIAFIGTRGVPARYGGFETCAEEIGRRLADRGHDITVYARSSYYPGRSPEWEGMRVRYEPAVRLKSLETLSHTAFSLADAVRRKFDVLLVFNVANSPLLFLARRTRNARWSSTPTAWNGCAGSGAAWGGLTCVGRRELPPATPARSSRTRTRSGDITEERYGRETVRIAYGAEVKTSTWPELIAPYGIEPGRYVLQITRFEPENNADLTVRAFEGLKSDVKLVLVGGALYRLDNAADDQRVQGSAPCPARVHLRQGRPPRAPLQRGGLCPRERSRRDESRPSSKPWPPAAS